ncbi:MAG: hypothetical protein LBE13_04430 [Bacteroidales bacterium]|jgi:hypothetical protein|nr:hypothetical protein [Bacteroidales bacterium]
MNSLVISGVVGNIDVKRVKTYTITKLTISDFKCVCFKDDLKIKKGDYVIAKGYLKLHAWQDKKIISDIQLQMIEVCPSAPIPMTSKLPEKKEIESDMSDTDWLEDLKNE